MYTLRIYTIYIIYNYLIYNYIYIYNISCYPYCIYSSPEFLRFVCMGSGRKKVVSSCHLSLAFFVPLLLNTQKYK